MKRAQDVDFDALFDSLRSDRHDDEDDALDDEDSWGDEPPARSRRSQR